MKVSRPNEAVSRDPQQEAVEALNALGQRVMELRDHMFKVGSQPLTADEKDLVRMAHYAHIKAVLAETALFYLAGEDTRGQVDRLAEELERLAVR